MVATPANSINESGANGAVIFDGVATFTTANGTATHVLTSNGVGVAPTFQAAAGGVSAQDYRYVFMWGGM